MTNAVAHNIKPKIIYLNNFSFSIDICIKQEVIVISCVKIYVIYFTSNTNLIYSLTSAYTFKNKLSVKNCITSAHILRKI